MIIHYNCTIDSILLHSFLLIFNRLYAQTPASRTLTKFPSFEPFCVAGYIPGPLLKIDKRMHTHSIRESGAPEGRHYTIVTLSLYGPQLKRSRSVVFITNAQRRIVRLWLRALVMKTTLLDHLSLGPYKESVTSVKCRFTQLDAPSGPKLISSSSISIVLTHTSSLCDFHIN